ncbi:MAG TPA: MgtC/SapB family protein [Anaeromyxobacteraceae bacterium]|nr:MgtC/SapB family protein [Anaeromyxobacteraceae bacterium]
MPLVIETVAHLGAALIAGGAIGAERTYHGRAAGFRTHALVCAASSMLMMLPHYQDVWVAGGLDRLDPTRMAQGIMTGIGFLGAGVIIHDGLTVRGLTTAASIWATAAIGILAGVGLWLPGAVATALAIGILSVFRKVEEMLPAQRFARFHVRFAREQTIPEADLHAFMKPLGIDVASPSYAIINEGRDFQFGLTLRTSRRDAYAKLAQELSRVEAILEFRIEPY